MGRRSRWPRAQRTGRFCDVYAVTAGRDELRDRVSECGLRMDVKDRKGVFALVHTTRGENYADKMGTGVLEERERRGFRKELDISGGDVTDNV